MMGRILREKGYILDRPRFIKIEKDGDDMKVHIGSILELHFKRIKKK